MTDHWGANENDLIVDTVIPKLVRALALCQDVMDEGSKATDDVLGLDLDIIDVTNRIIDALASCREYEKWRTKELDKQAEGGAAKA